MKSIGVCLEGPVSKLSEGRQRPAYRLAVHRMVQRPAHPHVVQGRHLGVDPEPQGLGIDVGLVERRVGRVSCTAMSGVISASPTSIIEARTTDSPREMQRTSSTFEGVPHRSGFFTLRISAPGSAPANK
jgi:hypothetical protein